MPAFMLDTRIVAQILCALMFLINFSLTAYYGGRARARPRRGEVYRTSFNRNRAAIIALILNISLAVNIAFAPGSLDLGLPLSVVYFIGLFGIASNLFLALSLKSLDINYQPYAMARKPAYVVTTGPYRIFRHPIYVTNKIQFAIMFILITGVVSAILFIVLNVLYHRTGRDEDRCNDEILQSSKGAQRVDQG
jgi:protein-S-isoprenylcysteine O-methyltransferase Ste14